MVGRMRKNLRGVSSLQVVLDMAIRAVAWPTLATMLLREMGVAGCGPPAFGVLSVWYLLGEATSERAAAKWATYPSLNR